MKTLRPRIAGLLLLLLPATVVGAPQETPPTSTPEYDYNPTFEYSFFSNVTGDDYDNLTDLLLPTESADPRQTPGPPDQPGSAPPSPNLPPAPTTTEQGGAMSSATSLPLSTGSSVLLVSLILIITSLQHTG